MKLYLITLASLMVLALPASLYCQVLKLPTQNRQIPIEISAKEGIEWLQKEQVYIARGNAFIRQGATTVYGNTISAWYTKDGSEKPKIFRIDAKGDVRVQSAQQTAHGTQAVYIIEQNLLILTGSPKLFSGSDSLAARDSLEFWAEKDLAIARGAATVSRGENRLRANVLRAHLGKNKDKKTSIKLIEAYKNVLISTKGEIILAEKASYNLNTGIAKVEQNVRITRGDSQLNGDKGIVNFKTGVSQIFSSAEKQVRGFFQPPKENLEQELSR